MTETARATDWDRYFSDLDYRLKRQAQWRAQGEVLEPESWSGPFCPYPPHTPQTTTSQGFNKYLELKRFGASIGRPRTSLRIVFRRDSARFPQHTPEQS